MSANLFAVCPHDTARGIDKWALFNTFVNKDIGLHSRFQVYLNFTEFGADLEQERFMWAYLNPADTLKVRTRFGYQAVARPVDRFDVAYVVGPRDSGRQDDLGVVLDRRLAAVKGYLFLVVKHRLLAEGIGFLHVPAKSYAEVMTLIERGDADFGVTYNEHFDLLSPSVREQFSIVASVHAGLSHVIAVHPSVSEASRESLRRLLLGAAAHPAGQKVLAELGMKGFEDVPEEPFLELARILEATPL